MLKRLLTALAIGATALAVAFPAAATEQWTWTDISGQLTTTKNRPVWAMAYANGFWFSTDGQELWSGGQVNRYNGSSQTNITLNVRNTGLSRVDEIVSDGVNVVFLKNVVRLDNSLEAIMFRDGIYTSVTSLIRQPLETDEGISSIVGRNGTWLVVTTRARLFRFNQNFSSFTRLETPADMKTLSASDHTLLYSSNQGFDRGHDTFSYAGIEIAPVGNSFLLVVDERFHNTDNLLNYYTYSNGKFNKIARPFANNDSIYAIGYNQSEAFLVTDRVRAAGRSGVLLTHNGVDWKEVGSWFNTGSGPTFTTNFNFKENLSIAWDGSNWLVLSGKKLFRVTDRLELAKQLKDYFVTVASNNKNTILFGGAVSTDALVGPSEPLTAKMLKAVRIGTSAITPATPVSTSPDATVIDNASGISAWTWLNPSVTNLKTTESSTYNVGAWDTNGLKRTEIWVNGSNRRTCEFGNSSGNQNCSFVINANEFPAGTQIAFNAKIVDAKGNVFWTQLRYVYVSNDAAVSNNLSGGLSLTSTPNNPGSISVSSDAEGGFTSNQKVTYTAYGYDQNGIDRIELYVNAVKVNTCYGVSNCSWTSGYYYTRTSSAYGARLYDKLGNTIATGYQTIYKK